MKTKFRWDPKLSVWEFFEAAWGGWCILRETPYNSSPKMTFSEGFSHIARIYLGRGQEHEIDWLEDRCSALRENISEIAPEGPDSKVQPIKNGWLCPKCGRGNAPTTPTCPCMGRVEDGSTCSNAVPIPPSKGWTFKNE